MKNIKVFQRHCNVSSNSIGKNRPEWFSREKCWENLKLTSDSNTEINVIFDGTPSKDHFLYNNESGYNLICMPGGNDAKSFLNLLEHVYNQNIDDNTILYFLEDDYIHQSGWTNILREGFEYIGIDYITLYDHNDKYFLPMYDELQSKVIATPSIHWRTVPSTTNTYAMLAKTFKMHYNIHKVYCDLEKGYTRDHDKFLKLWNEGSHLISCIPGYSTHCETEYLSPVIDWSKI